MARHPAVRLTPGGRHGHGSTPTPVSKRLTAAGGSFVLTGFSGGTTPAFVVSDAGFFTVTAPDINLSVAHVVTSDYGSVGVTGQAATLTYSGAITPTYSLTSDYGAFFLYGDQGPSMPAANGSFAYTGQDATLRFQSTQLITGSFTLAGQAATLTYVAAAGNSLLDEGSSILIDENSSSLLIEA